LNKVSPREFLVYIFFSLNKSELFLFKKLEVFVFIIRMQWILFLDAMDFISGCNRFNFRMILKL